MAEFVCQTIEQFGAFDIRLVFLPTSARDEIGVALIKPASWLRGVHTHNEVCGATHSAARVRLSLAGIPILSDHATLVVTLTSTDQ